MYIFVLRSLSHFQVLYVADLNFENLECKFIISDITKQNMNFYAESVKYRFILLHKNREGEVDAYFMKIADLLK